RGRTDPSRTPAPHLRRRRAAALARPPCPRARARSASSWRSVWVWRFDRDRDPDRDEGHSFFRPTIPIIGSFVSIWPPAIDTVAIFRHSPYGTGGLMTTLFMPFSQTSTMVVSAQDVGRLRSPGGDNDAFTGPRPHTTSTCGVPGGNFPAGI